VGIQLSTNHKASAFTFAFASAFAFAFASAFASALALAFAFLVSSRRDLLLLFAFFACHSERSEEPLYFIQKRHLPHPYTEIN
jgi:hypothetical protein